MRRSPVNCSFLRRAAAPALACAALVAAAALMPAPAMAEGDAKAGEKLISNCIGCHSIPGYKASYPTVYAVPLIAGQSEKYLANALAAYKKGDRDHPTMRAIAGAMSEEDIANIAAYFADFK